MMKTFKIWIDADACPREAKELVYRSCARLQIPVVLVANSVMNFPQSPLVQFVHVGQGADVADQYIVDHANAGDLVITADIPLAAKIVAKDAVAMNPRGEIYDEENISERLSMRDFLSNLRDEGVATRGPAPYSANDRQLFANNLNAVLTKLGA